jgi:hypothetical protein
VRSFFVSEAQSRRNGPPSLIRNFGAAAFALRAASLRRHRREGWLAEP